MSCHLKLPWSVFKYIKEVSSAEAFWWCTAMTNGLKDWTVDHPNGKNILFKGRNYIPQNTELWWDIVHSFHDHETAGHPREIGTYNAMWQNYRWPGLQTFIKNYVQGCDICQQFKLIEHPLNLLTSQQKTICQFMDLITDLLLANRYNLILVMLDQGLLKGVILSPATKKITSEDTAKLLLEGLYKQFGLPDIIISDRGPQFASKAFTELLKLLRINLVLSTAYHP